MRSFASILLEEQKRVLGDLKSVKYGCGDFGVDKNSFENLMLNLYWNLSPLERAYYGRPDIDTVVCGEIKRETDSGRPVGMMIIHDFSKKNPEDKEYWISVAVEKNYRGTGLTDALFKDICDFAKNRGIFELNWCVDVNNSPSVSLAKRLGFDEVEQRRNFLCLRKTLAQKEKNESFPTKDNIRRFDKDDGILYSGPAKIIVDKVKSYDNSNDLVINGRIGDYPEQFRGAKIISTNIKKTPLVFDALRKYQNQPAGIQLPLQNIKLKKQDKYNFLRATITL